MRVAGRAQGLDSHHSKLLVQMVRDRVRLHGLRERGPARAGLELLRRVEQERPAADASIATGLEQTAHLGAEGSLRACLAGHVELFRSQYSTPFGGRLLYT